jgi:Transposase IS4
MQLHAAELLDVRRAEAASLESDVEQESPDEPSPPALSSSSEEGEEEKEMDEMWSADKCDVNALPFITPSGKQHEARRAESPLDHLQLFLPPALLQQWADYTNDYAQQGGAERGWRTTAAELYAFLGVHIYMGICFLPQWHMYWSHEYQQPFVASVFPRWRFEQLLRYFHIAPPPAAAHARDSLSRIRPLMQSLQHSFPRMYAPSRCLALDEAMVAYKGRSPIKQYIPSKPHKWGYKIYCLASDDYLLHFEVYEGKEEHPSPLGATADTALRMTTQYQHQQHVLFTDSWFTSPVLLDALKLRGIRCCGSVRRNRRGMPRIADAEIKSLDQGQWLHRQQGDTSVAVWND